MKRKWMSLLLTALMLFTALPALGAETSFEKPAFKSGKVRLTFAEAPLRTMTETPFAIAITGATGKEVRDAKLSLSLDMPAMPMPPNHPKAAYADGAYRGTAIFTMAGAWTVEVKIQRPGYDAEQVTFSIKDVKLK